jgi:hypothetical protein
MNLKLRTLVIGVLVVLVVWGCNLALIYWFFPDWQTRGQFGDLFGAINSLFSGLAFAGLIYTIILQGRELSLQRDELRLQREEMVRSREQLAEQARLQKMELLATISQLKITSLQTSVKALEFDSLQWKESARARYAEKWIDLLSKCKESFRN